MATRMQEQGAAHLWLDATPLTGFGQRFPTIAAALARAGLDPATDWLPIAPAAHYLIGGVLTDLDGATTLPGLWAAGEVACTGVHGANRLASNSLLEGMVFGARVVEAIARGKEGPDATGALRAVEEAQALRLPDRPGVAGCAEGQPLPVAKRREALQHAMSAHAGVVRDAGSLARAVGAATDVLSWPEAPDRESRELRNLAEIGQALGLAASARRETRGCHTRTDFPERSPALVRRLVIR